MLITIPYPYYSNMQEMSVTYGSYKTIFVVYTDIDNEEDRS